MPPTAQSAAALRRPAIGEPGGCRRSWADGPGPSAPPEREAQDPSGPPEREAQGPSGPPEREAPGPSGPPQREGPGPDGPPEREAPGPDGPGAADGCRRRLVGWQTRMLPGLLAPGRWVRPPGLPKLDRERHRSGRHVAGQPESRPPGRHLLRPQRSAPSRRRRRPVGRARLAIPGVAAYGGRCRERCHLRPPKAPRGDQPDRTPPGRGGSSGDSDPHRRPDLPTALALASAARRGGWCREADRSDLAAPLRARRHGQGATARADSEAWRPAGWPRPPPRVRLVPT